jgi:hypothetical protein
LSGIIDIIVALILTSCISNISNEWWRVNGAITVRWNLLSFFISICFCYESESFSFSDHPSDFYTVIDQCINVWVNEWALTIENLYEKMAGNAFGSRKLLQLNNFIKKKTFIFFSCSCSNASSDDIKDCSVKIYGSTFSIINITLSAFDIHNNFLRWYVKLFIICVSCFWNVSPYLSALNFFKCILFVKNEWKLKKNLN